MSGMYPPTRPELTGEPKDAFAVHMEVDTQVREYLIAKGLPKDAIKLSSWGPDKPADTKARSRRVEVVVLGGAG